MGVNTKTEINAVVWLDLLCWASLFHIFFNVLKPASVNYCQCSFFIRPFIRVLEFLLGMKFNQIDDIVSSRMRIQRYSLYEYIHIKIKKMMEEISGTWKKHPIFQNFIQNYNYDEDKVYEHLKEASFLSVYRPTELYCAASLYPQGNNFFVLRKTPFADIFKNNFNWDASYYTAWLSYPMCIFSRENYLFDTLILQTYFMGKWSNVLILLMRWLALLITIFQVRLRNRKEKKIKKFSQPNIGVDFMQRRYRDDEINELFWLKNSNINANSIYNFETRDFDQQSSHAFDRIGINRIRLVLTPWEFSRSCRSQKSFGDKETRNFLTPDISFLVHLPVLMKLLIQSCFLNTINFWPHFQLLRFHYLVLYWKSIYEQLNIRMTMSIVDIDSAKLAKAQALRKIDAVFLGSHWSNFPMIRGDVQKHYDILFTWGPHFLRDFFDLQPSLWKLCVGYPLDFYFNKHEESAMALKCKHGRKFILTYFDNIMSHDLPYSMEMQLSVYKMIVDLLEIHNDLVVFFKPKKAKTFERIVGQFSELNRYMKEERVVVFYGNEEGAKEVPAKIGMASDLVVGLGISSAAAECQFAGTPAFHADLTGFCANSFGNSGLNKVVFRDVEGLKNAISDYIQGNGRMDSESFRRYHACLDPFQDGKAYRRIGFVMHELQKALAKTESREKAVQSVQELCEMKPEFAYDSSEFPGDEHYV